MDNSSMFVLVNADEALANATAHENVDETQVAYAINYAASCQQTSCIYQHHISDDLMKKLIGMGYTVENLDAAVSLQKVVYKISWEGDSSNG